MIPRGLLCFALLNAVLLSGCGGGGPNVYELSGTVSFDGDPLPYGRVTFVPDTEKGNSGGAGYADVINGEFDTAAPGGRGVIGGPHRVRFTGFESQPTDDGADEVAAANAPPVKMLFRNFEQEHDLPEESSDSVSFEIPALALGANVDSDDPSGRRRAGEP